MIHHRQVRAVALLVAALVALGACGATETTDAQAGDPSTEATPDTTAAAPAPPAPRAGERPYPEQVVELDLVDRSRPTTDGSGVEVAPDRTLPTTVHVPQGDGPFPLVVFAHGFGGDPQRFSQLLGAWAEAGYVVAAPTFPVTSADSPHRDAAAWAGVADQPADLSFVLDEVLELSDDPASPLAGTVDPERIAGAGMSLGGGTAYGIAFNDCCLDDRLDAVVVLGGLPFPVGGEPDFGSGLPSLVVHGDADATLPYAAAVDTFAQLAPPKFLVTLFGGSHSPPYEDWESPWDGVAEAVTVDFWDAYLAPAGGAPDEAAIERLVASATVEGVSAVDAQP